MIRAKDAVVWINRDARTVQVHPRCRYPVDPMLWGDPIGANYTSWQTASTRDRIRLMPEAVIDLAMAGYPVADILRAFAEVEEFRALGRDSSPMCRALTAALVGQRLEACTMSFDELLAAHAKPEAMP